MLGAVIFKVCLSLLVPWGCLDKLLIGSICQCDFVFVSFPLLRSSNSLNLIVQKKPDASGNVIGQTNIFRDAAFEYSRGEKAYYKDQIALLNFFLGAELSMCSG